MYITILISQPIKTFDSQSFFIIISKSKRHVTHIIWAIYHGVYDVVPISLHAKTDSNSTIIKISKSLDQRLWCHEVNNSFKVKKTDITTEEKIKETLAIEARTNSMKF